MSICTAMALKAGMLQGLMLHQVLGAGTHVFDSLGPGLRQLERLRVLEGEGVTHLHYRVS